MSESSAEGESEETGERDLPRRYHLAGRTPARIVEELTGTLRAPDEPMDWRSALAMFAARERAPAHTWSRPSRRFPTRIFEVPGGEPRAPRRTENPRLLVAIDTSLSMSRRELEEIARQLARSSPDRRGARDRRRVRRLDRAGLAVRRTSGERRRWWRDRLTPRLRPTFPGRAQRHRRGRVLHRRRGAILPRSPPPVPTLWVLTKRRRRSAVRGERSAAA